MALQSAFSLSIITIGQQENVMNSLLTLKDIIKDWKQSNTEVTLTKYLSGKYMPIYDENTLKFKGFILQNKEMVK